MDSFVVLPRAQVIQFVAQVRLVLNNYRLFIPEGCIPNTCARAQVIVNKCDDCLFSLKEEEGLILSTNLTTFIEDYLTLSAIPISVIAEKPEVFDRFFADLSQRAQVIHSLLSSS